MKRDDKLFSIGEIAKALGVTRRIILHYEERGLIEPDKRDDATNNRYYTIDTFTKLRSIRSLQNLGLTLDEIRDYYNDSTDLMPLIRRMEEMRDQLNLNIEKLYERAKVSSAQVKERVDAARAIQSRRFEGTGIPCNAQMTPPMVGRFCELDSRCDALMKSAFERMGLTARSHDRVLRVARTIADLDSAEHIGVEHLSEAIQYRNTDILKG
mgnify:FL=1